MYATGWECVNITYSQGFMTIVTQVNRNASCNGGLKKFYLPKKHQNLAWICHKSAYIDDRDACYDAPKLI